MAVPEAFVGAVIGAVVSFVLAEYSSRRSERKRMRAAVQAEVSLNSRLAEEIRVAHADIDWERAASSDRREDRPWVEIIGFSDGAWTAALSGGRLNQIPEDMVPVLTEAYTKVRRANFIATKIQVGRFDYEEGHEYSRRVADAGDSLAKALQTFGE